MQENSLVYQIAITMLPNVGDVLAKNLISYCGGVKEVFSASYHRLIKVPGIGPKTAKEILDSDVLEKAETEVTFVEKNKIKTLFYLDEAYPYRLKECYDNPVLLYYKGNADLNNDKIIGIVGTREATDYGKSVCEKLIGDLAGYDVLVVSGMAYGIDICAHKASLENNLQTVGVLGHGLDRIYPFQHKKYAVKMLGQGGLLTEFNSASSFDKENFPKRNRIIAGLVDALIVVETKLKGGSMITAEIANSYDREVFAVPGNVEVKSSEGCNYLIKTNKGALLNSANDLIENMGWELNQRRKRVTRPELTSLEPNEKNLVELLQNGNRLRIEEISSKINMPTGEIASGLLNLELKGIIKVLPGNVYQLMN